MRGRSVRAARQSIASIRGGGRSSRPGSRAGNAGSRASRRHSAVARRHHGLPVIREAGGRAGPVLRYRPGNRLQRLLPSLFTALS